MTGQIKPDGEFYSGDGVFTIGAGGTTIIVDSDPILGGWRVDCSAHGRLTTRHDHGKAVDYARRHAIVHGPQPTDCTLGDYDSPAGAGYAVEAERG